MHLDALIDDKELKFIFVGGKGGVGKTTSSSALATQLSYDRKVLLISTDPAHSLGDAFRLSFSNQPSAIPDLPNLSVMEIDPQQSLQAELQTWAKLVQDAQLSDDLSSKIEGFQQWLSGVPGIDEGTALASAIGHIESGEYDVIVFDTAPTGHTLKLLGLPEILQVGLEKLESWQSTLWGYWKMITGGANAQAMVSKKEIATRLRKYKHSIGKVAKMLQDSKRTRFVLVCIAEFLSISESRRLLRELISNNVQTSHVIVNQLVQIAFSADEIQQIEKQVSSELVAKTKAACYLTSSRHNIQSKYLKDLKESDEAKNLHICEVQLLPNEVTGVAALREFSMHLVSPALHSRAVQSLTGATTQYKLYDDFVECDIDDDENTSTAAGTETTPTPMDTFAVGNQVTLRGLDASHYNGIEGKITQEMPDGRYGVLLTYEGQKKQLAVNSSNLVLAAEKTAPQKSSAPTANALPPDTLPRLMGLAMNPVKMQAVKMALETDPDVKAELEKNERVATAVRTCLANPMSAMQYLGDTEVLLFITNALDKVEAGQA